MEMADLIREHDCVEHGNLRDSQGKFDKALSAYNTALQIDPGDADALFNKGATLVKLGKIREAQKCFDTATKMYVGDYE